MSLTRLNCSVLLNCSKINFIKISNFQKTQIFFFDQFLKHKSKTCKTLKQEILFYYQVSRIYLDICRRRNLKLIFEELRLHYSNPRYTYIDLPWPFLDPKPKFKL